MKRCIDCGIYLGNYGEFHGVGLTREGPLCHLCYKRRRKKKQLKLEEAAG